MGAADTDRTRELGAQAQEKYYASRRVFIEFSEDRSRESGKETGISGSGRLKESPGPITFCDYGGGHAIQ